MLALSERNLTTVGKAVFCRVCSSWTGNRGSVSTLPRQYATQSAAEPFLSGSSSAYIEDMYSAWQEDPSSVHKVN